MLLRRNRPQKTRERTLSYIGEFRANWSNLAGACIGVALGAALNHYMLNLFGPPLIAEFGWARSQFALVGSLTLISLVFVPIAGHFADRFGARVSLMVGFTAVPLAFLLYSLMDGNILQFYAITLFKNMFGVLTTTLVFARVIVERFNKARGMALSVLMSGPPLIGAAFVPVVGEIIESEGWRTAYRTLAAVSAMGGLTALLLIGRRPKRAPTAAGKPREVAPRMTWDAFRAVARQPAFLLLIGGMFLCNFPQVIVSSQLNLVLMDSGATASLAIWLVSLYATAVVVGRFLTGFGLDRLPSHIVAGIALGMPTFGYLAIASSFGVVWLLVISVALIGLAQGAEGDVGAFMASRHFPIEHYSFIYSFLIASMGGASAIGAIVLSATLHVTDSFNLFLMLAAALTVAGAACFYLTGRLASPPAESAEPQPPAVASGEPA